jgi:hypothetical protein
MSLQAAHPEPTTTTLGFSSGTVGPRPEYSVVASVLKHAREANENGFGALFLGLMPETRIRLLNQAIVRVKNEKWNLCVGLSNGYLSVSLSEILKMKKDSVTFAFDLSCLLRLWVGESRGGSVVMNDCVAAVEADRCRL